MDSDVYESMWFTKIMMIHISTEVYIMLLVWLGLNIYWTIWRSQERRKSVQICAKYLTKFSVYLDGIWCAEDLMVCILISIIFCPSGVVSIEFERRETYITLSGLTCPGPLSFAICAALEKLQQN